MKLNQEWEWGWGKSKRLLEMGQRLFI